jgi:hypothetical protein
MKLSNKVYDWLKFFCTVFVPALGTLIFAINKIWQWPPYAENIVGTLSAVAVFIGAIIGISSMQYNKHEKQPPDEEQPEEKP